MIWRSPTVQRVAAVTLLVLLAANAAFSLLLARRTLQVSDHAVGTERSVAQAHIALAVLDVGLLVLAAGFFFQRYRGNRRSEGALRPAQRAELAGHAASAGPQLEAGRNCAQQGGEPHPADRALMLERDLLRAVIDNVPEHICIKDRAGHFLLTNRAHLALLAAGSETEVVGKTVFDYLPREVAEGLAADDELVLSSGQAVIDREEPFVDTDGRTRWYLTTKIPLRDRAGQVNGLMGVSREITLHRMADEAIRASESRYRELFEANPHPMWVYDKSTLRFRAVNDAAVLRYGYPRAEFLAMTIQDIRPPEERARLESIWQQIPPLSEYLGTWRHLCKDGGMLEVEIASHDLIFEGRAARMVVAYDVTRRKRAEAQLASANQRLQLLSNQLLRAQEHERARVSRELHDEVGQTFTAVRIHLRKIRKAVGEGALATAMDEGLAMIDQALQQVRALSLDLRPPQLDVLGLPAALQGLIRRLPQLDGLHVELGVQPPELRLDPEIETACFRIAQEALTNALRHAQAHSVKVSLEREASVVRLTVEDDGRGFDPDAAQARAAEGRSMGLISMQERASLVGGTLRVARRAGGGTRVEAIFPISTTEPHGQGAHAT